MVNLSNGSFGVKALAAFCSLATLFSFMFCGTTTAICIKASSRLSEGRIMQVRLVAEHLLGGKLNLHLPKELLEIV